MQGDAHWFPLLLVLLGGGIILYAALRHPRVRALLSMRYRVRCPSLDVDADVDVLEDPRGRAVDVKRCSALAEPTDVTCDRACLAGPRVSDPKLPPARGSLDWTR